MAPGEGGFRRYAQWIAPTSQLSPPDPGHIQGHAKAVRRPRRPTSVYNPLPGLVGHREESPLKYAKRQASHFGGTRQRLRDYWPSASGCGGLRTPVFSTPRSVPTILEVAGLRNEGSSRVSSRRPCPGLSMVYTFEPARDRAEQRHYRNISRLVAAGVYCRWMGARHAIGMKAMGDDHPHRSITHVELL